MEPTRSSETALFSAFVRYYHHAYDKDKIFDDNAAQLFLTVEDRKHIAGSLLALSERLGLSDNQRGNEEERLSRFFHDYPPFSELLARAQFGEEHVLQALRRGVSQYVIVGAGFETFAFRQGHHYKQVQIFEIDHPDTQRFKKEKIRVSQLKVPDNVHFIPGDLEQDQLEGLLDNTLFSKHHPSIFSWLGVIPYLTRSAFIENVESIRNLMAPGSVLIFNYLDGCAFNPNTAHPSVRRLIELTQSLGEPLQTGFSVLEMHDILQKNGFTVIEDLTPTDQMERYFNHRSDGYSAMPHNHFLSAMV